MSTVTAGPSKPEHVGHPAGHHAAGRADREVAFRLAATGARAENHPVVLVHRPRRTPRSGLPRSDSGSMPRVLERLPRRLQQQPLLRVHRQRLARADPEEARVEVARRRARSRPRARTRCPGDPGRGRRGAPGPSRGRRGTPTIASPPRRHQLPQLRRGLRTPPGNRQPIPTIAIGSSTPAAATRTRRRRVPLGARRPCRAAIPAPAATGVGWSNTSVAGSRSPVAAVEAVAQLDRRRASRTPARAKARSTSIASAESCPSTAATWARTSSSTTPLALGVGGTPARRRSQRPARPAPARPRGARTKPRSSAGSTPHRAPGRAARRRPAPPARAAARPAPAPRRAAPVPARRGAPGPRACRRRAAPASPISPAMPSAGCPQPPRERRAGRPRPRRRSASASRNAFAAA